MEVEACSRGELDVGTDLQTSLLPFWSLEAWGGRRRGLKQGFAIQAMLVVQGRKKTFGSRVGDDYR